MSFFQELKRRNVVRMAIAYSVVAWVLLQFTDFVLEVIDAPGWILQVFVLIAAVGLPVVLIFSWIFEMTPEGLKRESEIDRSQSITPETGRKIDRLIIGALALAVVILLADRFVTSPSEMGSKPIAKTEDQSAPAEGTEPMAKPADQADPAKGPDPIAQPAERSIAVLPFAVMSSGVDDEYFADGLTEEILNSLAQLPELLVTARTSAFAFKGQELPIQEIASQLGVRNVVEGSVRRSGERLRVTAQLIRASDGFHLWSENYDSTEEDTITVQEDIAEKIAHAMNVVLDEKKREAMKRAGLRDVEAFIAWQKGVRLYEDAHGSGRQTEMLGEANVYFETIQQRVPNYAPAYSLHTDMYIHQLMDDATGQDKKKLSAEEVTTAFKQVESDLKSAVDKARNSDEKDNAELDLAFVMSDWQGMPARIERYLAQDGCEEITWIPNIATLTGYADRMIARSEDYLNCDPLSPSSWRNLVRDMLWAGNAAGAEEIGMQAEQKAPGHWLDIQMNNVLVSQGKFDAADRFTIDHFKEDAIIARVLIAAARGDREAVEPLLEEYSAGPVASEYFDVIVGAWSGNREMSNTAAAIVDQHEFGSPALITIALWCTCGEAWDLAVTPNFARNIAESGLPWPPKSPIRFPLKDQVAEVRVSSGN